MGCRRYRLPGRPAAAGVHLAGSACHCHGQPCRGRTIRHPLLAANLYQVLDTSDVPGGVVNIVTGERDVLAKTLAEHDEVDALWYVGSKEGSAMVEKASCGNLKATWVNNGRQRDWANTQQGQGKDYLRRAVQVKNIWVPYGE